MASSYVTEQPRRVPGRRLAAIFLAAAALAGCGKQERDPNPIVGAWYADIEGLGDDPHSGFAVVTILPDGRTRANVTLTGGSGGGAHPWHVHVGSCDGPVVGDISNYPVLRPDARGNAGAVATLGDRLAADQKYFVNIHRSPGDDSLVGCGELISNL